MGAPKKYTPEKLKREVRKYFQSITREVTLTEQVATDQRDRNGHVIFETRKVCNALGQEVKVTEYLTPPTVGTLAEFLGIHRDTWHEYCGQPEFSDTTTYALGRIHAYLERELLTRQGKDLKGVLFNLENNFGYRERMEVSSESLEAYLKRMDEEGTGGRSF